MYMYLLTDKTGTKWFEKKTVKRTVLYGEYVNEIMSLTDTHSKKMDGIKEINDTIFSQCNAREIW